MPLLAIGAEVVEGIIILVLCKGGLILRALEGRYRSLYDTKAIRSRG